jgi:hypothetical protein
MAKISAGRYLNRLTERIEARRNSGATPDDIAWYVHAAKQGLSRDQLPLATEERAALDRLFPEPDTEQARQARCDYQERQRVETEDANDEEEDHFLDDAAELLELAAEISAGDYCKMMTLLTLAAASATMIPFNNAETGEASAARIANRTAADEEMIEAGVDHFVDSYRYLTSGLVREMAMSFTVNDALPMPRYVSHKPRTGGHVHVSFRELPGGTYMAVEMNRETGEIIGEYGPLTAAEVQKFSGQLASAARKAGKPFKFVSRKG